MTLPSPIISYKDCIHAQTKIYLRTTAAQFSSDPLFISVSVTGSKYLSRNTHLVSIWAGHEIVTPVRSCEQIVWRLLGGGMHVIVSHQDSFWYRGKSQLTNGLTRFDSKLAERNQRTKRRLFYTGARDCLETPRVKNAGLLIEQTFDRQAATKRAETKYAILVCKWKIREPGRVPFITIFDCNLTRPSYLTSQV